LRFFDAEVKKLGAPKAFEHYVYSAEANGSGVMMAERFIGALCVALLIDSTLSVEDMSSASTL